MAQSSNLSTTTSPHPELWLVESFASRAGLLAIIYLCVNVVYQEGYLYKLGFEFGFFSITKTLPIFDNFLVAFYAFVIWGVLISTASSTYDQFFSLFNMKAWRDTSVASHRVIAIVFVAVFYFMLHNIYLQKDYWSGEKLYDPAQGTGGSGPDLILRLLWPTWGFVTWGGSLLAVIFVLAIFGYSNLRYRMIRGGGLNQLIGNNINRMMFHLDIISPAGMLLGALFLLIMVPASYGKAMADISLGKIRSGHQQEIALIELDHTQSFCGEQINSEGTTTIWRKMAQNESTIHLLGHWGDSLVFAKIGSQDAARTLNKKDYSICILPSSVVKMIVFAREMSQP